MDREQRAAGARLKIRRSMCLGCARLLLAPDGQALALQEAGRRGEEASRGAAGIAGPDGAVTGAAAVARRHRLRARSADEPRCPAD